MAETIELLATDSSGKAVQGVRIATTGPVKYPAEGDETIELAYPHKFFALDSDGHPRHETLVKYLVPEFLLNPDGSPSRAALRLVAEREGWET